MLLTRLRTEGEQAQKALASKQHELAVALAEIAKLRAKGAQSAQSAENEALHKRVGELERELSQRTAAVEHGRGESAKLARELADARDESTRRAAEVERSTARIAELERELAAAKSDAAKSVPPTADADALPPGTDDLTSIKGIGPKFQRVLNAAGIRSFAAIAAWTDAEVDAIAPKLRVKPERIRRERWVEHARELSASSR